MKAVLVVFAALCIGSALALHVKPLAAQEYQFLFKNWMNQHGKQYEATGELETRYAIWKQNLDTIRKHESNPSRTFTMAMNKFGDLSPAEFKEMYLSYNPINNAFLRSKNTVELNTTDLPDSVDWEKAGKITGVKDQGQCGSCWAFSTTGSTEGAYAVENNADPISLSEQELVDCSQAQGNQGCNGGLMDQGFQFIITNGGICAESDYPYKAVDGSCASSSCKSVVTVAAFTDVPANNEAALQAAVAQQPVSVAVDAETWQFYSGGVMSSACGTSLDHGVLAVGYGTDNGAPYWRVKNSWGTGWGETGFIRLARGKGTTSPGECGIAMVASYPTGVKKVSAKSARKHRLTLH